MAFMTQGACFQLCRYSEWIDECELVNHPDDDGAEHWCSDSCSCGCQNGLTGQFYILKVQPVTMSVPDVSTGATIWSM